MTEPTEPTEPRRNKPQVNRSTQQRIRDKRKAAAMHLGYERVAELINAILALSDADAAKVRQVLDISDSDGIVYPWSDYFADVHSHPSTSLYVKKAAGALRRFIVRHHLDVPNYPVQDKEEKNRVALKIIGLCYDDFIKELEFDIRKVGASRSYLPFIGNLGDKGTDKLLEFMWNPPEYAQEIRDRYFLVHDVLEK